MYLSRKKKRGSILLLIFFVAMGIWSYKRMSEQDNIPRRQSLAIFFERMSASYFSVMDSCYQKQFSLNYRKTLEVIDQQGDDPGWIGERVVVRHDSVIIETFLIGKRRPYAVTAVQNMNGVVSIKRSEGKFAPWMVASFCDEHRFFLPKADFPDALFDGYSYYSENNGTGSFMQLMLADKHKPVSGVVSPCNDWELKELIRQVDEPSNRLINHR